MITVEWDKPDSTIICYTIVGRWTWDEFYTALQRSRAMMTESPAPKVDYIIDMRQGATLPSGAIAHFNRLARSRHPKSNRVVLVGVNRFIKAFFDIFAKVYPTQMNTVFIAESVEEARSRLTPPAEPPSSVGAQRAAPEAPPPGVGAQRAAPEVPPPDGEKREP